ncbi:MAG: hypothetical protein IJA86_00910 [Clostridia bacterium]|nr:hypothetical protein [Clostridia bacterium]
MNKKNVFAGIFAVLLAIFALTACKPSHTDSETTEKREESSSEQNQNDFEISARNFADRVEAALASETRLFIDFDITQKHIYSDSFSSQSGLFVRLQADMSNAENPCFSYCMKTNPDSEEFLFLFYDGGYIHRKDSEEQYKYPISWEKAKENIPFHLFLTLFGENWKEIFSDAQIFLAEDHSVTAYMGLPLSEYLENAKTYLKFFGGTQHENMSETDAGLEPIFLSVTLDENGRIRSYSVDITMEAPNQKGSIYPVEYTVRATLEETAENFRVEMPDPSERAEYREAEPEISEITLEEFIRRFSLSDEKSQKAIYTKMITNANAIYSINGMEYKVPLSDITQLDLSDPKKPNISVVEIMDFFGVLQSTEIYYKDEIYYYAIGGEKYSVFYPAEKYLSNVQASAQEKAEAGVSTFFMTREMLSHAIFTVNPDQLVTAVIYFDGEIQKKNILHNINSIYNDDFSTVENVSLSNARVSVTLDRYNYMTAYFLDVTVTADMGSGPTVMHYSIQYQFEYSDQPVEIIFPDDLNFENYPNIVVPVS